MSLLQSTCRRCRSLFKLFDNVSFKGNLALSSSHNGTVQYSNDATADLNDTEIGQEPQDLPLMTTRQFRFPVTYGEPRLAWVESMDTLEGKKLGMVDLHPDVFATYPRLDILKQNLRWQEKYREIDYEWAPSRAEMPGGGKKPWQQKGTGRARHGSIRSPIWIRGGQCHGPRGPTSGFYMLSKNQRAIGLRSALSCKYAQNDLVIVDSLDIPTSDREFLSELSDVRFWGYSVLFVDDTDMMPENISLATEQITGLSLMPAYGLNVYSMLKHDTLVLTLAALKRIESKLLEQMNTTEKEKKFVNTLKPEDFQTGPEKDFTMYKQFTQPLEYNYYGDEYDHPVRIEDLEEEEYEK